jgi:hypothetical protein
MRWPIAFVAILLAGCGSDSECNAPAHTEYTCEPIAPGSVGCVGGPRYQTAGGSFQDDPDQTFPLQCGARVPACSPTFQGSPRSFQCAESLDSNDAGIDAAILWFELL